MSTDARCSTGRRLPPYQGLVAVDAERFSRNPSADLTRLNVLLHEALTISLDRASLHEASLHKAWTDRNFGQSTGDGFVFGVEPSVLPFLIHPWLDVLHEVLGEKDLELRSVGRHLRLRLRVSVHVGPVPVLTDDTPDPVSAPTNEVFRLLDAPPTRQALARSNPEVTFLAAVVSQRVFEDVIAAGYTSLHADEFEHVTAEIPRSDFIQPAWLYLPRSSRRRTSQVPVSSQVPVGEACRGTPTKEAPAAPVTTVHGDVGQVVTAQQIHGGVRSVFRSGSSPGRGPSRTASGNEPEGCR